MLVSGHAFSVDGASWNFAETPPYTNTLAHTDGPPTVYTSLERPHLVFDQVTREPTHIALAAAPAWTSPLCAGCRRAPGTNSSCVLCKLTQGIDWTHTAVIPLATTL